VSEGTGTGKRTSTNGVEDARDYRTEPGYRSDAVWEHKKGRVWRLVEKLERRNRTLEYQVRVLQARLRAARPKDAS
jgi:hypothetical protein